MKCGVIRKGENVCESVILGILRKSISWGKHSQVLFKLVWNFLYKPFMPDAMESSVIRDFLSHLLYIGMFILKMNCITGMSILFGIISNPIQNYPFFDIELSAVTETMGFFRVSGLE